LTDPIFTTLLLPHIALMEPYAPIEPFEVLGRRLGRAPEEIVKLDANENPYGPHPAVREALAAYPFLHVYPDPAQRELRGALADYTGVPAANIMPGHGADELIDLVCRITVGPGDAVIDCPPTFGMYSFDAGLAGAVTIRVPRLTDFQVDVAAIESAVWRMGESANQRISEWANQRVSESASQQSGEWASQRVSEWANRPTNHQPTNHQPTNHQPTNHQPTNPSTDLPTPKLLFLASPNNPDGGLLDPADLRRLLRLPVLVVVDEAYIEFAGLENSAAGWVLEYDNLIVLRTFSKWAGLAGLRLGYGIFPDWLMPALWRAKQPYNVNVAATVAGLASLAQRAELQSGVDALIRERERLYRELARVPYLRPYPSRANFVLCRVEGRDAVALQAALASRGILVRHYAKPGLENCLRISAGRPEHTDALLAACQDLCGS